MITDKTVRKVSKLAKLQLDETEIAKFTKEFQDILELFSTLASAPVDDSFTLTPTSSHPPLREDIAQETDYKKEALALSKHTSTDYFKGPKTL